MEVDIPSHIRDSTNEMINHMKLRGGRVSYFTFISVIFDKPTGHIFFIQFNPCGSKNSSQSINKDGQIPGNLYSKLCSK